MPIKPRLPKDSLLELRDGGRDALRSSDPVQTMFRLDLAGFRLRVPLRTCHFLLLTPILLRQLIAALTTATGPSCVRWVQNGPFPAILKQTYRKTDLMRTSERQMDARIRIFGSTKGIECMSETFDRLEHRSYLSTSDLAMQTAARTYVSECARSQVRPACE